MDFATLIELPEKIENEWLELETAFSNVKRSLEEFKDGQSISINCFLIEAKNLTERAGEFYNKLRSIIAPSKKG